MDTYNSNLVQPMSSPRWASVALALVIGPLACGFATHEVTSRLMSSVAPGLRLLVEALTVGVVLGLIAWRSLAAVVRRNNDHVDVVGDQEGAPDSRTGPHLHLVSSLH